MQQDDTVYNLLHFFWLFSGEFEAEMETSDLRLQTVSVIKLLLGTTGQVIPHFSVCDLIENDLSLF